MTECVKCVVYVSVREKVCLYAGIYRGIHTRVNFINDREIWRLKAMYKKAKQKHSIYVCFCMHVQTHIYMKVKSIYKWNYYTDVCTYCIERLRCVCMCTGMRACTHDLIE